MHAWVGSRRGSCALQEAGAKRGGVPQFQQPHVLLVGGFMLFEQLCAGFADALLAAGGQPVDWLKDGRMVRFKPCRSSGLHAACAMACQPGAPLHACLVRAALLYPCRFSGLHAAYASACWSHALLHACLNYLHMKGRKRHICSSRLQG
jgi:hypothetical protein